MAYRNAEISAFYDLLRPHDTLNPPDSFWIESSEGEDVSGGKDYCEECGSACIERLNLYTPGIITHDLACSDPCGEHDSVPHCAECGKTLAGWLTDYGVMQELDYFAEEGAAPTPENIHVVNMVLWNLQWSEDDASVDAWRSVAEKFLAKLPQPTCNLHRSGERFRSHGRPPCR